MFLLGDEDRVCVSVPDQGGVTLEWGLHALLASHYLEVPVYPCPEDWDEPHILGPGVMASSSELSVAWCWSPLNAEDMSESDPGRILSFAGEYTANRYPDIIYPRVTGPSALRLRDLGFELPQSRSGIGICLSEADSYMSEELSERSFRVFSDFWTDRSRDPLEEVRDRLVLISSFESLITSSIGALGAAQALGVPVAWAGPEAIAALDHFSFLKEDAPRFLNFAGPLDPAEPDWEDFFYQLKTPEVGVGADFCLMSRF